MSRSKQEWNKLKTIKTPKFRVSFPHVFKPHKFEDNPGDPKFSVVMLFPKDIDLKLLKTAANAAAAEKWGEDQNKWPKQMRRPFRDGDEKTDLQGYEGCIFVSASSNQKPGVVDGTKERRVIESEEEFYAGCYARAEIRAFAYDVSGNKGVSFALLNLQKLAEGEPFSGKKKAEVVFDDDFELETEGLDIEGADGGDADLGF